MSPPLPPLSYLFSNMTYPQSQLPSLPCKSSMSTSSTTQPILSDLETAGETKALTLSRVYEGSLEESSLGQGPVRQAMEEAQTQEDPGPAGTETQWGCDKKYEASPFPTHVLLRSKVKLGVIYTNPVQPLLLTAISRSQHWQTDQPQPSACTARRGIFLELLSLLTKGVIELI